MKSNLRIAREEDLDIYWELETGDNVLGFENSFSVPESNLIINIGAEIYNPSAFESNYSEDGYDVQEKDDYEPQENEHLEETTEFGPIIEVNNFYESGNIALEEDE